MSKHLEKTKRYLRFFAAGPGTIDDLISHLGLSSREDKIGKRKVRHTIGDLTHRGLLRSSSNKLKNKSYWLTHKGKQVVGEFHTALPDQPTRSLVAEKDTLACGKVEIIPKENDFKAPPAPVANNKTKQVGRPLPDHLVEAVAKFYQMVESDASAAMKYLGKQVIILRDELSKLKDGPVSSKGSDQNNS